LFRVCRARREAVFLQLQQCIVRARSSSGSVYLGKEYWWCRNLRREKVNGTPAHLRCGVRLWCCGWRGRLSVLVRRVF